MDELTKTIDRIVRNFAPHTPGCWAAVAAAYDAGLAAERERCAKLVQNMDTTGHDGHIETTGDLCEALAACIRRA